VCRAPGVVRLLDRLPTVVRDDLRPVEPLEIRVVLVAQLLRDVLLGTGRRLLFAHQGFQQRTLNTNLIYGFVAQVEVEADLAGVDDLLCGERHGIAPVKNE